MHDTTTERYIEVNGEPWCLAKENALKTLNPQLRAAAEKIACSSPTLDADVDTLRMLGMGAVIVEDRCMGHGSLVPTVTETSATTPVDDDFTEGIETAKQFEGAVFDAIYDCFDGFYDLRNITTFDEARVDPPGTGMIVAVGKHTYQIAITKIE